MWRECGLFLHPFFSKSLTSLKPINSQNSMKSNTAWCRLWLIPVSSSFRKDYSIALAADIKKPTKHRQLTDDHCIFLVNVEFEFVLAPRIDALQTATALRAIALNYSGPATPNNHGRLFANTS